MTQNKNPYTKSIRPFRVEKKIESKLGTIMTKDAISSAQELHNILILTNAQVIEFARFYLSECSATNDNLSDNPTGEHSSPDFKWFGCETDAELLEEIQKSACAEGNLIPTRADHLVRVLDVMYFS